MGVINIFEGLNKNYKVVKGTGKINDILPDFDFKHSIILKAGDRLTSDYYVSDDDIIFIRRTAAAASSSDGYILKEFNGFLSGLADLAAKLKDDANQKQIKEAQERAQKDAENLADKINNLPFIRGSSNNKALGSTIQYLIGEMYNTPYLITDSFPSIAGSNGETEFYNVILSCGNGKQLIKEVLIGNEKIKANENGIPSGVTSLDVANTSAFYDSRNKLEICQPTEEFESLYFRNKVKSIIDGSTLKNDFGDSEGTWIEKELAENTKKVEICVGFNALRKYYTSDESVGCWGEKTANLQVQWSNDGGSSWQYIKFDTLAWNDNIKANVVTKNSKSTIRYIATKEFTASESYGKQIKIRVRKQNAKEESNTQEDAILFYVNCFCYDVKKSSAAELVDCKTIENDLLNTTTRIGLRIVANTSTEDRLNEIHTISTGIAKTWNGEFWSIEKTATRNPASWLLEIMTSDKHKHSQFLESELYLNSFGALYEYCAENEFNVDMLITSAIKKNDLIARILEVCNSTLILNSDGLYEVVIDKKEINPIALLNAQSIKSLSYTKDLNRKPDGVKVNYTNRNAWAIDTFYAMLDGGEKDADDVCTELNLDYVTDYNHAYKMALRAQKQQQLQPRILEARVGKEGDYYPLYSKVLVQVEQLKKGIRSSIIQRLLVSENMIIGVEIGDLVYIEGGYNYGVIIQAQDNNGKRLIYRELASGETGDTKLLYFATPILINNEILPVVSNQLSFGLLDENGEFTRTISEMKIYNIAPDGNDGYILTLKDYNDAIYESGEIPAYKSNLTTRIPVNTQRVQYPTYNDFNNIADLVINAARESAGIRKLNNLQESGYEGEVAIYNGFFYEYKGGNWYKVQAENYLGVFSVAQNIPVAVTEDDYFLAGADMERKASFKTSKGLLKLADGSLLGLTINFKKGFIYICKNGTWQIIENRNDYRYIIATNDLVSVEGEISDNLIKATYQATGRYIGAFSDLPADLENNGNYFLANEEFYYASGEKTKKGFIYRYKASKGWEEIDAESVEAYSLYMAALNDTLKITNPNNAAFATMFVDNLIASKAFIRNLNSATIELEDNGVIKSKNYDPVEAIGFKLTADGEFVCNNGTYRGDLECGPLVLSNAGVAGVDISFTNQNGENAYNTLLNNGVRPSTNLTVTGTLNGNNVNNFNFSKTVNTNRYMEGYFVWAVAGSNIFGVTKWVKVYSFTNETITTYKFNNYELKKTEVYYEPYGTQTSQTVTQNNMPADNPPPSARKSNPIIRFTNSISLSLLFGASNTTFKLLDLPDSRQEEGSGIIWADPNDHILRIS